MKKLYSHYRLGRVLSRYVIARGVTKARYALTDGVTLARSDDREDDDDDDDDCNPPIYQHAQCHKGRK
jgi:hypothetical protein